MDPAELRQTAAFLGEQAGQIQEAMTGTRTACSCDVPRSLVGWIDDELVQITESALVAAVAVVVAGLDCAVRAAEIETDQSLALAQSTGLETSTVGGTAGSDFSFDPAEWLTTMTIGGPSAALFDTTTPGAGWTVSTIGGPSDSIFDPTLQGGAWTTSTIGGPAYSLSTLGSLNGPAGASMGPVISSIMESQSDAISTILAPSGLTYSHGAYEDSGGYRGNISSFYEDPYSGDFHH
jgi:hypothetical protein